MDKKNDNKRLKKWIVNGLTLSRVAGALAMPVLSNFLSAPVFLIVIASILFTDLLDGFLAKRCWDVSTIFGSLADMWADKILAVALLIILTTMYPAMGILLGFELLIPIINSKSASHGAAAKSSQIGRFKTVILGLSMCTLFLTGLSPELIQSLESLKVSDLSTYLIDSLNEVIKNKTTIETVAQTAAITSEVVAVGDYAIKAIKQTGKSTKTYKMSEYLKNKKYLEYMKKVMFDEKYYKETVDMSLYEKLTPPEYRVDGDKVKKLTLDNKK